MSDVTEAPAPGTATVERAWSARRQVDPAQLDPLHLTRYRHPSERRALVTIGLIIVILEVVMLVIGPSGRENIEKSLHWLPHGLVGTIMTVFHPGGVTGTVAGLILLTTVVDVYNHWLQGVAILSESTEVTATTFPALNGVVEGLRKRFAMPWTRVFVQRTAPSSYSLGMRAPYFIVIPVGWVGMLTSDELQFFIGHEMGHIKLRHTQIAPFTGGSDWGGSGGALSILSTLRGLILGSYQQAQELSCDRVGVVASGSVRTAFSALIKVGIGTPPGGTIEAATLAEQADEVHHGSLALPGRLRQFGKAQPSLFFRLKELVAWGGLPEPPPPSPAPANTPAVAPTAAPAPAANPADQSPAAPPAAVTAPTISSTEGVLPTAPATAQPRPPSTPGPGEQPPATESSVPRQVDVPSQPTSS